MSIVGAGILVLSVSPSASYAADVFCNADPNCIVATAAGPGALPGATDPNALINDPAQTEAKVSLAASNQVPLDTDLVETATQPAPDESTVPDSNPGDGGPGASGKVAISGYSQGNHPWCVPAATATTLSAFGVTSDVAYLASEEGTTAAGTPIGNAVPSLRKREKRNYYIYDHQSSASDLMSKVATDIWNFQAPVIVGVDTRDLSWWSNSSSQGAHVLTVYLYYTSNGGGFRVQDSGAGGKYSISLANLTAANNARGSELDW